MKIKFALLIIELSVILCLVGEAIPQANRDVRTYEAGPTFDLNGDLFREAEAEKRKLRKYLWNAWNRKKQVYFRVFTYTREGRLIDCMYYIEKKKNSSWKVKRECEPACPSFTTPEELCKKRSLLKTTYNKVEVLGNINDSEGKFYIILGNSKDELKL